VWLDCTDKKPVRRSKDADAEKLVPTEPVRPGWWTYSRWACLPRGRWCVLLSAGEPSAQYNMARTCSGCLVVTLVSSCAASSEVAALTAAAAVHVSRPVPHTPQQSRRSKQKALCSFERYRYKHATMDDGSKLVVMVGLVSSLLQVLVSTAGQGSAPSRPGQASSMAKGSAGSSCQRPSQRCAAAAAVVVSCRQSEVLLQSGTQLPGEVTYRCINSAQASGVHHPGQRCLLHGHARPCHIRCQPAAGAQVALLLTRCASCVVCWSCRL
jgi:hypothetical protein